MFFQRKAKTRTQIEIDQLVLALGDHKPTSAEYGTILERLAKLSKIQDDSRPDSISKDNLLVSGVNLLGIMMIIHHENLGVISTKALSFVQKAR